MKKFVHLHSSVDSKTCDSLDQVAKNEYFRINMTISCHDCDFIPKVPDAGKVIIENNNHIQIMHNGIKIIKDCYYGAWTTEIIRQLKGHHEPQEEAVFSHIIERLFEEGEAPVLLELGAFWSYYSLWALKRIPTTRAYLVEPDPHHLEVGRKNFSLNNCEGVFLQAGISDIPVFSTMFKCEDNIIRNMPIENLPSLFNCFNLDHLDILLLDIQGAETKLLRSGELLFKKNLIRFVIVSTHHHSISNDSLTHQKCLEMIKSWGGHIIAEHTVTESYSGDGLIAASFEHKDQNLVVNISYARACNSLFPELEYDLAKLNNTRTKNRSKTITEQSLLQFNQILSKFSTRFNSLIKSWYMILQGIWNAISHSIKKSYSKIFRHFSFTI